MEEVWDLYDCNKNLIDKTHIRGEVIVPNEYHLAVDIWCIDNKSRILLTQRHPDKPFGLYWECSGGAVLAGETSIQGAVREVSEEIGLNVEEGKLNFIGTNNGEDYIMDTYKIIGNINLKELCFQQKEVIAAKIVTESELRKMKEKGQIVPTVWERFELFHDLLFKHIG